jgi:hypothetical protein
MSACGGVFADEGLDPSKDSQLGRLQSTLYLGRDAPRVVIAEIVTSPAID